MSLVVGDSTNCSVERMTAVNSRNSVMSWCKRPTSGKYEHLLAGVSGGAVSTLILHPLDLLKIRFAVNDGQVHRQQYKGLRSAVSTIIREEGIRGLYRGVVPNVWGAGMAWGAYFYIYSGVKTWMENGNAGSLGPASHMLAAAEAGVLTLLMTNPILVVKTRLCLQYSQSGSRKLGQSAASNSNPQYRGMVDAFIKVYRYEGVAGLYRGFVPGVFGVSHGAVQFMAYEEMKKSYTQYRELPVNTKLTTVEYLTIAVASKLIAALSTYPYQVVRARLQDQNSPYAGTRDAITQTWRVEGVRGFYKGMTPYLCHVTPSICIIFLLYEHMTPGANNR